MLLLYEEFGVIMAGHDHKLAQSSYIKRMVS